jgi:hypothetical protein
VRSLATLKNEEGDGKSRTDIHSKVILILVHHRAPVNGKQCIVVDTRLLERSADMRDAP